jgi:polyferredoxin
MTHEAGPSEVELREQAIRRLKKKQEFRSHAVAYVLVNALLVAIWAVTGGDFFWPIFPIAGWGIALAFNAWDVYGRKPITEEAIRQEQERLRR